MGLIESGTLGKAQAIIERTFGALRVTGRPADYIDQAGNGGHYRVGLRSGTITGAGVVAGAPLFAVRWGSKTRKLVLLNLEATLTPTVVFTAAQELGLDLIRARGFTVADSAGTAIDLTKKVNVLSTKDMNGSEIDDMRIAAATLLTAGTRTLEANPFLVGSAIANVKNAAAGTEYVNPGGWFGFVYKPDIASGEYPIELRRDEGLIIRNTVAFPAAGSAVLSINMAWLEVAIDE